MQKKPRVLIMVMVLLLVASMAVSQALALPPKVGVVCVQNVGSGSGGGAFPMDTIAAARMLEYAGADVYMIDSGDILDNNILADLDYFAPDELDAVRNAIRDFIYNGGGYIGICAGAYFGADVVVWPNTAGKPTRYEYYLDLFMGDAVGPLEDVSDYPDDPMALTTVRMVDPDFSWNTEVVGVYDYEINGVPGLYDEKPAMIKFEFGSGRVFLSGVHPELEESATLANSRDWAFGDDYGTDDPAGPVADPDTEWDMMADVLAWLCPNSTISKADTPLRNYTAAVYGTLGTSARVLWPTMKMLYSLGIQPYAYDSHANTEITIDKFDMAVFPN
ncbi:MAG: hypothetical protein JRJ77_13110, partial [Deltaproteobacteria bacterium]|nr:hypothetical protein [Deltaproteobacteria bacterium]